MKKQFILLLMMLLSVMESASQTYTDAQGVVYTLIEEGSCYAVTGHTETLASELVISSELFGIPVTRIANEAFVSCEQLVSVEFPVTLEAIGGVACTYVGTRTRGGKVWKWSWDGNYTSTGATQPTGIIFSNNGSPQTKDLTFENGGYYLNDELKGNVITSVPTVKVTQGNTPPVYYNLKGQRIAKPTQKGLYIQNGKKMILK